ncbi:NADP-dependent methylenetetrahydromethanopterin/methylenetetrahydrofolate dehydrogenase [Desulfosporosinus metallidurans]|uniref:Methylene tetrahydromethanopterin dehydrogenase n=1 Tax=Desulfosporosinus metallidurans TaxID=1888891 RepID=A0A1Q8QLY0_9FIRM|nr:NADP-dependent methylenetetrahydromethanopterin/methylenetetrahydrofolate dehydrogenase [Desulfosporosinus metallidurans]OLN28339.1 Methylene tetrahydromethanopterin dehydrogenase [Desulfosporosinus metallidurans]
MKKILIHLESDSKASIFDQITAYDAGADQVLAYGGVQLEEVANLVYGAIFTRGGEGLRNTAVFIGGTQVPAAEKLMRKLLDTFFADFRVSVMFDANGCNTTAAALVNKIAQGRELKAKKALVLAGTGPVGIRAATLLVQEGCEVFLSSRQLARAQEVCKHMEENIGVKVKPVEVVNPEDVDKTLAQGINIIASCGAPGVRLLEQAAWASARSLEIIADINAVEPLGVEGMKVTDNGKEREGKILYGAIAIGNLKMKVHRAAVQALFERNDQVLDFASIYALAKKMEA